MKNQLAIALAITAIALSIAGLVATIVAVWPDEPTPVATGVQGFAPMDIGQPRPAPRVFVGPELPADQRDQDEEQADDEAKTNKPMPAPTQPNHKTTARNAKQVTWKPAVLQVVTNFEQADVKVNGLPYPEYYEPGQPEGMVLPAGGPYAVEVKFGSNTKNYSLYLRPHETRLLLVELSGTGNGTPTPPVRRPAPVAKKEEPAEKKEGAKESGGKITVYSKPAGTVIVDGADKGEKTPGSVDLDNGRHEVQVKYETGTVSEKKIVRVRTGSRIKLFFRERKK